MDLYFQEHDIPADQRPGSAAASDSAPSTSEDAPTLLQIASTLATLSATTTPSERVRLQTHLSGLLAQLSAGAAAQGRGPGAGSSPVGTPPASAAFLRALQASTVRPPPTEPLATCPVCTDEFEPAERVARLPCGHLFHVDCVLPWLRAHSTCPVCRAELPTDDPVYEDRKRRARREKAVSQMRAHMFN